MAPATPSPPRSRRRDAGPYAGKGLAALRTARECVELGACKRTIELMTGLPSTFILRFVFDRQAGARRGRPAYSDDFIARAPLRVQAGASAFAARYERLRDSGFAPAPSLITAFRHYLTFPHAPRLLFDEAFYLCCNLDGIWACSTKALQLADCRGCASRHLQPFGSGATSCCAFCNGRRAEGPGPSRQAADLRQQPHPSRGLDTRLTALTIRRSLHELGASERVVDALMSGMPQVDPALRPPAPSGRVCRGVPLPLQSWGAKLSTLRRVGYSLVATLYGELRRAGFPAEEAVVAAYRHLEARFSQDAPLTLDRCVEVVSLAEARWGVAVPELLRNRCGACGADYLVSRRDPGPQPCPFCLLRRHPAQYRGDRVLRSDAAAARSEAAFPLAGAR